MFFNFCQEKSESPNLDKLGADWAVKLITELAGSNEIKSCSLKALEEMERSALQRKVDAALAKNNLSSPFSHILVDVTDSGKVHLSGWTQSQGEWKKAVAIIKDVPGVSEVTSDIFVQPVGYA